MTYTREKCVEQLRWTTFEYLGERAERKLLWMFGHMDVCYLLWYALETDLMNHIKDGNQSSRVAKTL